MYANYIVHVVITYNPQKIIAFNASYNSIVKVKFFLNDQKIFKIKLSILHFNSV